MSPKRTYAVMGISVISIPIAIWWGMPDLVIYGGLSGLDCAFYALLMILFIKREMRSRNWIWVAVFLMLLTGLAAKIIYESVSGMTIFVANTHTGRIPVPLSHLVGGCVGFLLGIRGFKPAGSHFRGRQKIYGVNQSLTSQTICKLTRGGFR